MFWDVIQLQGEDILGSVWKCLQGVVRRYGSVQGEEILGSARECVRVFYDVFRLRTFWDVLGVLLRASRIVLRAA